MKFDQIKDETPEGFRRLTGIKRTTFDVMTTMLREAEVRLKAQGGKPNKLSIADRLLMTLEYLREYRTYFHISRSYGISESACYRNIRWVEDTLIKDGTFSLPGRKALLKSDVEYEIVLIDATETPIERPKKKQRNFYSGKKKKHTIKTQLVVDKKAKAIICTSFSNGKCHDFRLFKESGVHLHPKTKSLTDTGYQGIHELHPNSELPKKRTKNNPLTKEDKKKNRELSSERILNENVIGMVKRFKIIADRYRNRRKRFGLRFNLIAGIYNFEL